jgi:hypothetical protein
MSVKSRKAPRVSVTITQELIDDAIKRDSSHCKIAEAIKAAYPGASRISVDLQCIRFSDLAKGERYTYLTPRVAQVGLVNWDQGTKPDPYEFQLRNGQVTAAGRRPNRHTPLTEAQTAARAKVAQDLRQTVLTDRGKHGSVPDRVGGAPPPLARDADNVPFSRRRAFGLRRLAY